MVGSGAVIWDFDRTLARRATGWSGMLLALLNREEPAHGVELSVLMGYMVGIWPWDRPEREHPELADPADWWADLVPRMASALRSSGAPGRLAEKVAAAAAVEYSRPEHWSAVPDAAEVLRLVRDMGWRNAILSNHCPELPQIVRSVGLADHVDCVLTSAAIGVEKPHRKAFEVALQRLGNPTQVWMVGDSLEADVEGAGRAGIPAVLVHGEAPGVLCAPDLATAIRLIARRL